MAQVTVSWLITSNSMKANPQVAARLIEPLIKLSRYDNQRQTLMSWFKRLREMDNSLVIYLEKIEKALIKIFLQLVRQPENC